MLTIAVDNRRRRVIEFRGKYNMRPNDKQRTATQRYQMSKPYLHLLRKSPEIMRPVDGAGATAARLTERA